MKVFFYAYPNSPKLYFEFYRKIYKNLQEMELDHTSKFIDLLETNAENDQSFLKKKGTFLRGFIKNIKTADIVVLEASVPSISSGYLMREALSQGKPIVILYHEGNEPFISLDLDDEKISVVEYNSNSLLKRLKESIVHAKKQMDVRFNFFIPPEIISYLNFISANRRISKSMYIRDLILADMKKNEIYKKTKDLSLY